MAIGPIMPGLSLFSGTGSLDVGVDRGLGPGAVRPLLYVERDACALGYLAAAWDAGVLPPAFVWSDLTCIPERVLGDLRWVGRTRGLLVTGGFPCQPHSVSGRRRHQDDERYLWPAIADVLRTVRPRVVVLENVPGVLVAGDEIFGALAELGLDAAWSPLSSAATGGSHLRNRWWCLAVDDGGRAWLETKVGEGGPRQTGQGMGTPARATWRTLCPPWSTASYAAQGPHRGR